MQILGMESYLATLCLLLVTYCCIINFNPGSNIIDIKDPNRNFTDNCRNLLTTKFLKRILKNPSALESFSFDYYKRHSFGIPSKLDNDGVEFPVHRIDQVSGMYSWIGCRIHRYQEEDVKECASRKSGKLRVFYVGDSRARQLFEANLLEMGKLPWAVYGENVLIKNGKEKLILSSAELQNNPNVLFKYFNTLNSTSNFRNQPEMIKKHLQHILSLATSSVPDLVVISFIQWGVLLSAERTLKGFDEGLAQMRELSTFLAFIAPRLIRKGVKLIWLLVDDIKKYSFNHNQGYSMEWYNQIVLHHLRPLAEEGLINLWDSGFPVSLKVFHECESRETKGFFSYSRFKNMTDGDVNWKCSDMSHVGPQGTKIHVQLVYNFVCNKFLSTLAAMNYCCLMK